MNLTIPEVIAVVGVLAAFLTALVSLVSLRWSKQAFDAKDAQLSTLKQQLDAVKERSPAELHKQVVALKDMMGEQISRLENSLNESNDLLRRKTAEISEDKRAITTMMGYGKLLFGIDDGELMIRNLYGFLYTRPGLPIDYGEQQLAIWTFYVNAVRLLLPDEQAVKVLVERSPEWILDYLIMPLLASIRFRSLLNPAKELLNAICDGMEATPFSNEVSMYRAAMERAEQGYDFLAGNLPSDLAVQLITMSRGK